MEDGWARELDNWSLSNPVNTVQKTEDAKILQGQDLFPRDRNRVKEDMQVVGYWQAMQANLYLHGWFYCSSNSRFACLFPSQPTV